MRKFEFIAFHVFIVLVLSLIFCCSADPLKQPKRLSNNQQRLFSFPRVGRGHNSWDIDMARSNPGSRYSLFAFPRVGKSERNIVSKRNGANNMNSGLWFGPRLGRVQKRDVFLFDLADDYPDNEFPELEHRQLNFSPRSGRNSEESSEVEDKEMEEQEV